MRGRQRWRHREQMLQRPNFAALVLDVAIMASKKRERRGIAGVVGDEGLHDAGCALDVGERHVELVHVQHGIDVTVAGPIARLEDAKGFLVATVAHQHRPLLALAGNQRHARGERSDRQRDDEQDVPEHQRGPPGSRQVTSILTGPPSASASTVSARIPSSPTSATSSHEWSFVSNALI